MSSTLCGTLDDINIKSSTSYSTNLLLGREMKEVKRYHFVYRITNIKLNKHYYGTHTTSKSKEQLPHEELGIVYFSSSLDTKFINDQKVNPQKYKYKIIRIFKTRKQAIEFEIKLHNKFDVAINESFYNNSKQTSTGFDTTGKTSWNRGLKSSKVVFPIKYTLNKELLQDLVSDKLGYINSTILQKMNITSEKAYCIIHEICRPLCDCGKPKKFISFVKGYKDTCTDIKCRQTEKSKELQRTTKNKKI